MSRNGYPMDKLPGLPIEPLLVQPVSPPPPPMKWEPRETKHVEDDKETRSLLETLAMMFFAGF